MIPKQLVLMGEGEGDEAALPILIRRLLKEMDATDSLVVDPHLFKIGSPEKFTGRLLPNWTRKIQQALLRKRVGGILVVVDGDNKKMCLQPNSSPVNFCEKSLGEFLTEQARRETAAGIQFSLATVFACREYESWLLGGIESLSLNHRDLQEGLTLSDDFRECYRRGAKEWFRKRMRNGYSETTHQAEFTRMVDLDEIRSRNLRSFVRLENAVKQLVEAVRTNQHVVTPCPPD